MSTTPNNLPYLDGWRGLAIVLVLQSHFGLGGGGRLGVALFFALSGYLMGGLLFVRKPPLRQFWRRRVARIVPAQERAAWREQWSAAEALKGLVNGKEAS